MNLSINALALPDDGRVGVASVLTFTASGTVSSGACGLAGSGSVLDSLVVLVNTIDSRLAAALAGTLVLDGATVYTTKADKWRRETKTLVVPISGVLRMR